MTDAFYTGLFLCITGVVTPIVVAWIKSNVERKRLDKQTEDLTGTVNKVGSHVATAVVAKGNEVKAQVYEFANGGPNGIKAQIREVLTEFVSSTEETTCPLMIAIRRSADAKAAKGKATDAAIPTNLAEPPPLPK